mmetsp:Transcript_23350/g.48510  ORF Transcript_23350/g.48510 Transcript_23350/m.48510 type:complete len:204 (+) Transcript_23350:476-1087(+)
MHDPDLMYVIDRPKDLHGELRRLQLRHAPPRLVVQHPKEVARRAQLEDEVEVRTVLVGLEEPDDIGVVNLSQNLNLVLVIPPLLLVALGLEERLQSVPHGRLAVRDAEDLGGSARAEELACVDDVGLPDLGAVVLHHVPFEATLPLPFPKPLPRNYCIGRRGLPLRGRIGGGGVKDMGGGCTGERAIPHGGAGGMKGGTSRKG